MKFLGKCLKLLVIKGAKMISEKIRELRIRHELTQLQLANKLGLTRSSVNAWEQGISVPSTQYLVELAKLFNVSTDYLLGVEKTSTVNVSGLEVKDVQVVYDLVDRLRKK